MKHHDINIYIYICTHMCAYMCVISTTFSQEFVDFTYLSTFPVSVPNSFGRQVLSPWQSRARLLCQLAQPTASLWGCDAHAIHAMQCVYAPIYLSIHGYTLYINVMYINMYIYMCICVIIMYIEMFRAYLPRY